MNYPEIEIHRHSLDHPWTYSDLDLRQKQWIQSHSPFLSVTRSPALILLSEVAPVITLGRRTPQADLFSSSEVPHLPVERGGLATYHGPGQWVLFVVGSLERLTGDSKGVKKMVCQLLQLAEHIAKKWGPAEWAHQIEVRSEAELGVWGPHGKLAQVGIHVSQGIVTHGLAINFYPTRLSFQGLRPCGLDLPVSYLFTQTPIENLSVSEREALELRFHEVGQDLIQEARIQYSCTTSPS